MRLWTLLVAAACAAPVLAADYRVNGGVAGNLGGGSSPLDSYDVSGSNTAVSGDAAGGNNDGATAIAGVAWSVAGPSGLRAFAEATAQQSMDAGPVGKQASASAYASMSYADLLVTGGVPGSFTMTSVNADLDGLFAGLGTLNAFGRAQVQVVFIVDGVNVGGGFQVFTANNSGNSTVSSGSLQGWNASGTVTSPSFRATVGQPFELELQLSVVTEATGPGNEFFFAQGQADFGHTLTFARNGPVFNLGAGLTLNSVEAGIADNLLIPVPEAPAAALMLAGLGMLAARSRRR